MGTAIELLTKIVAWSVSAVAGMVVLKLLIQLTYVFPKTCDQGSADIPWACYVPLALIGLMFLIALVYMTWQIICEFLPTKTTERSER